MKRFPSSVAFSVLVGVAAAFRAAAQDEVEALDPFYVHATHVISRAAPAAVSVELITADDLLNSPSLTLDDSLRQSPAFALFRRSGSLTANPTAQGVSLRGLGPSGASRSLVLLDGIPLNDPFGGWVTWAKVMEATLSEVRIVRGEGATTWGSAALGGTVEILSRPIAGDADSVAFTAGDFGTRSLALLADRTKGANSLRVSAETFATDGFPLVDVRNRGSIDRDVDSHHEVAQVDWKHALTPSTNLTVDGRISSEERGNGTPLQQNASSEAFLSASIAGASRDVPAWSGVVYVQRQDFQSFFSSVSSDRTSETPASNQYAVPSTAGGLAVTATRGDQRNGTTVGFDARAVEGETREAFLYSASTRDFTRQRFAGGQQEFAGAFVRQSIGLSSAWTLAGDLRLDYWRNADGHRQELDSASRAILRDDHDPTTTGLQWSPGAEVSAQLTPWLQADVAASRSFRLPTLNEYYRPFRVGSITTEANPSLALETNNEFETGFTAKAENISFSVTPFINSLRGAVTSVTTGPNQRQRKNLSLVVVQGAEAAFAWERRELRFRVSYLGTDTRVERGDNGSSTLVGNRLPEVPRHTVTASATWHTRKFDVTAQSRWMGDQFEDDENTLRLAAVITADLRLAYYLRPGFEIFVDIENVGDARVETGRSADGLVNTGAPRLMHGGFRWTR